MKPLRIFLLILLLLHVSHASDMFQALIDQHKYQECYDKALLNNTFDDASTQMYLSQCADKIGHTNMAIAALERVLFLEPDNVDAMLSLTQIYHRLELEEQKSIVSDSLDRYQLTPEQRTRLNTLSAKKEEELSQFSATVALSAGYNTNLNILPTPEIIESAYMSFYTALSYVHEITEKGAWFLSSNLEYLHKSNESAHYFDIDYGALNAGVGYKFKRATLVLPVYYRRLAYLDQDLAQEYGLAPKLDISISKRFILSLNAVAGKREFTASPYSEGNFEMIGGGLGGLWLFGKDFLYLKGAYNHYSPTQAQPSLFTAKGNYLVATGGTYNVSTTISSSLRYLYRVNDFSNPFIAATERYDHNHALKLSLQYKLGLHWKCVASYENGANFSNYDDAAYRKHVSELSLQYDY